MNIVVLLAGSSDDFIKNGHSYPKYLLELDGEPIVQRVIKSVEKLNANLIFIIRKEDNEKFYLGSTLNILAPHSKIMEVESITKGAVCTALFAIEQINNDKELLVINGDQLITADITEAVNNFRKKNLDGGIVIFDSVHPRWSYVLMDENGYVIQTSEKQPISKNATAGCYYYKNGADFVTSSLDVIKKDVQVNGLYYISSSYNEMILNQKKIGTYKIKRDEYISFATYQMYENYLSQRTNKTNNKFEEV